jgi:ribA/ribD-fused uncharacterized protein
MSIKNMSDNYLFFWDGIYSQWYPSDFYDFSGRHYNCAEQYMMASKAATFNDLEMFERIMKSNHPAEQKALGREVKHFNVVEWENVAIDIVTFGNYLKFTQNKDLYEALESTGNKEIIEASPEDRIWGIGLAEDDPDILDRNKWGKNWLGICIMRTRLMLFGTMCEHPDCLKG